ncbi:MAG: protoporphyrinogen oxidase [Planctomycetota bacterium]|jgi:oxygen-dependent protoporphyrinogen oxidase
MVEDAPNPKRVVVVGGGITGLAAAHRLVELAKEKDTAVDVTLLEAGERLGGWIRTIHRDGFIIEPGPDNFITSKPWGVDLVKRLGLEDELLPTNDNHRGALLVCRGKLEPIPEGFLLMAPTKWRPLIMTRILSWPAKVRMGMEMIIPRRRNPDGDESMYDFVVRRFGREALDRIVQPLMSGIYTADPRDLSLRATMPHFLEMEQKHGSVVRAMRRQVKKTGAGKSSGARYSMFVTLKGGLGVLIDTLTGRIGAERIRLNTPVASIGRDAEDQPFRVILADGQALEADEVIVTSQADRASKMLADLDAELSETLGTIDYASCAVVHLAYKREDVPHDLEAFGFVVPHTEPCKLIATTFSSVKYAGRAPEGHVLMRAFLGGAMNPDVMALSDEEMIAATREEYDRLLGVTAEPLFGVAHRAERAMPQYAVGHLDRVAAIDARLEKHPGLYVVGNAYKGVGIPNCVYAGENAAEEALRD